MKSIRIILLPILFLLTFTISFSQTNFEPELYSIDKLQEDFLQMRTTLEENHVNLYEYTNKETFDKLFDQQFQLIDRPMHLNEFYKILTPITAHVGCGHTNIWMPNKYWDSNPNKLFPLIVKMMEGHAVVTGNYNNDLSIPKGSIILKINGIPFKDIYNEFKNNYSADAFNEQFIISQIERRFSLIFARRFGFPETFIISYVQPEKKTPETKEVQPAKIQAVRSIVFENFHHPELEFEIIEEKDIAVMTIKTFIYYDRVAMFKEFLERSFKEIRDKKIPNLILDLRGNDGGDPFCSAPLFSYLISEPVPYYAETYNKYSELAEPIQLAENRFTGNLFTLINGRCFSTNAHFCSLLKYHKIGEFIGTEGGATYKCNAGKNTQSNLNNTQIMLFLGRSTYTAAVKNMDKTLGIIPDHFVEQTYKDYLNNEDTILEYTYDLIESRRQIDSKE